MNIFQLKNFYNDLLTPANFDDYCPNGLQIEGKKDIKRVAFAVSAAREIIEKAILWHADALVVHHGVFWKYQGAKTITGQFGRRIIPLIKNEINLLAYHLPLDGHQEIGNARMLADLLGLTEQNPFGKEQESFIGMQGELSTPIRAQELQKKLEQILNHQVIVACPDEKKPLRKIGIVTGGGGSSWGEAKKLGLDAFITGEIREHEWYDAQEGGITLLAGGHSATERLGIQKLMEITQKEFKLECCFIESSNPV